MGSGFWTADREKAFERWKSWAEGADPEKVTPEFVQEARQLWEARDAASQNAKRAVSPKKAAKKKSKSASSGESPETWKTARDEKNLDLRMPGGWNTWSDAEKQAWMDERGGRSPEYLPFKFSVKEDEVVED